LSDRVGAWEIVKACPVFGLLACTWVAPKDNPVFGSGTIWKPTSFVGEPQHASLLYASFMCWHVVLPGLAVAEEEGDEAASQPPKIANAAAVKRTAFMVSEFGQQCDRR